MTSSSSPKVLVVGPGPSPLLAAALSGGGLLRDRPPEPTTYVLRGDDDMVGRPLSIDLSGPAPRPRLGAPYLPSVPVNPNAARHEAELIAAAAAKRARRALRGR